MGRLVSLKLVLRPSHAFCMNKGCNRLVSLKLVLRPSHAFCMIKGCNTDHHSDGCCCDDLDQMHALLICWLTDI